MLSKISVKKPYTVVVAVVLILILGFVSFTNMTTDLLPSMNLPYAIVMTTYVGASPEEVETAVTKPIESAMATVSNIQNISSVSSENYSMVILEFAETTNMDSVTIEMRESLDQIGAYWDDSVGSPIIMKLNPDMLPVMVAAVDADGLTSAQVTRLVQDSLSQELESLEGVASVSTTGDIEETIQVILRPEKIEEVNNRIRASLDSKFQEAQEEMEKGRDELESGEKQIDNGKQQLESGKQQAFDQIAEGQLKLEQAQQEIISGENQLAIQETLISDKENTLSMLKEALKKLEEEVDRLQGQVADEEKKVAEQTAAIENGRKQILEMLKPLGITSIPTSAEIEAQLSTLDTGIKALEAQIAELEAAGAGEEQIDALKAQKAQMEQMRLLYENLQPGVKNLEEAEQLLSIESQALTAAREALDKGKAELSSMTQQIGEMQTAITGGKAALEEAKAKIAEGKLTVNEAMVELSKNQALASLQMSVSEAQLNAAKSQIEAGKTQLDAAEEEFEKTKETAYDSADMSDVITASMIKNILTAQNFSMPAGYVTEDGVDYMVRVGDKIEEEDQLKNLVLFDPAGMGIEDVEPIRLSDVADVFTTDNSDEVYAKINGNPGIIMTMQKQTGYSTGDVSNKLKDKFEKLMAEDETLHFTVLMDQGIYIDMVVNSVLENMAFGGLLAVLILLLFLRDLKPTLIIACSIPISLLTAVVLMYFSGVTLNIISLSGLALGVGMLVDNSIVVIENVYRLRNQGVPAKKAAIEGATQVGGAIMASTLTTVSVFAPIVFTTGITRQLFVDMGLTIAYSLLASLVIALTLVPMMSAGMLGRSVEKKHGIFDRIQNGYALLLKGSLKLKPLVLIGSVVLLAVSGVCAVSRGTSMMPEMESTQVSITMSMEDHTPLTDLAAMSDQVIERLTTIPDVETVGAMAGGSMMSGIMGGGGGSSSGSDSVTMYLILKEDKELTNDELADAIEEKTADLNCELSVSTSSMDMSALGGSGISIQIKGRDLDKLQQIAEDVAELVRGVEGTAEVSDGIDETTEELRVIVNKDRASEHNLTVAQVYQAIAAELAKSSTATTISNDVTDYDVVVHDGEAEEKTRQDIRDMVLTVTDRNGGKEEVKLSDVADFTDAQSMASIRRNAQSRYITVSASIDRNHNIGLVAADVQKALDGYNMPEGYTAKMAGEDESINEAMVELFKMLALAIVFMYLIMVAQFQSLLSPFIIMFTIPLAFTGGLFGLYFTGNEISVIAMIGFVMLSGIIVNNGIVLVDYINQLRRDGMAKKEAIVEAGRTRLRPIIMTALTTVLGLSTMAMGMGMGSDMVQPMAIVTIGGLVYGTLLTLFVVPCIYDVFNREKKGKKQETAGLETKEEAGEDEV